MSHTEIRSSRSPTKGFQIGLQPPLAWTAILGLVLFSTVCILAGAGSVVRLIFPVGSFAVGVFLCRRYPILYIGFTWWIWFLTPLIRRLVDYRSGVEPQSVILLSPLLVTLVTLPTFVQHLPRSYRQGGLPFILAFIGIFYSFLIGLINNVEPVRAVRSFVEWLVPILFGFYIFVNWRNYPSYQQNTQRTFLWGTLVMGAYGVVQFLVAPEWDRLWLLEAQRVGGNSFGQPEPLQMRVWSTLNSPGHFASALIPCLLLLFNSQEALRLPALVFGYLAFLLSMVRTAWGGWFIGLLTLISSLKPRLQMRLIITVLVLAVCVFPLSTMDPFAKTITSRVETLSDIENDASYQARKYVYNQLLGKALTKPLGEGLGSLELADSGVLVILYEMGWLGGIFFVGGLILLFLNLFQNYKIPFDPFISTIRAASVGLFVMLPNGGSIMGLGGVLFWGFSGMLMAATKYYQHQGTGGLKRIGTVKLIDQ